MDVIINESTSVIQIDGSVLALPTVYISTTTLTDHFATVIDMTGYVTAANPLHLSTTGATFADGTTDAYIRQPFGYLSLAAISTNQWSIANRDPFSVNASTIRALDALTLNTATLSTTVLSTMALSGDYLTLKSVVAQAGTTGNTYIAAKALNVGSNLQMGDTQASTVQSATAAVLDVYGLDARIVRDVSIGGNVSLQDIRISSIIAANLSLTNLSTSIDTDTVTDLLTLQARSTLVSTLATSGLYFGSTCSIQGLEANSFQVPSATIDMYNGFASYISSISTVSIEGPMSLIQLGSAKILNRLGSMTTSALQMNTTTVGGVSGYDVFVKNLTTSSISLSTADPLPVTLTTATGDLINLDASWMISTNGILTSSMTTSTTSAFDATAMSLTGDSVLAYTLAPNTLQVASALALDGQIFYVPKASLTAREATVSTANAHIMRATNLVNLQNITADTLYTSSLIAADISVNTISTIQASTTQIVATNITLGNKLAVNPLDPSMVIESLYPINSPPYQYATGSGTFNDPFRTFNTVLTTVYMSLYNPSGTSLYLNIKYRHTNLPAPNTGRDGGANIYINGRLILQVLNLYEEVLFVFNRYDIDIANYPMQSPNPITGDSTPYVIWEAVPAGVTTDEITFWVSNNLYEVDQNTPSVVDPTGGIAVRKGVLEWPSTIYGTAISNQYNDIETRSLFYTGSLQSVSDRLLKRDLGAADLSACVTAAKTPLHTYEYRPDFASTFQIQDKRRLGILTTELSTPFPKSVTTEKIMGSPTHVASTDQLRYAHLGATKFLIAEVQRLRQKLLDS